MTITQLARTNNLQSITRNNTGIYDNQSSQCTQSQLEAHIYNLIQQGDIFTAKLHIQLINETNGYIVINDQQFKIWRIEILKNKNQNNEILKIKSGKSDSKNQNPFHTNQNGSVLKGKQKSNISSSSFQKEFQKAYMELLSN